MADRTRLEALKALLASPPRGTEPAIAPIVWNTTRVARRAPDALVRDEAALAARERRLQEMAVQDFQRRRAAR